MRALAFIRRGAANRSILTRGVLRGRRARCSAQVRGRHGPLHHTQPSLTQTSIYSRRVSYTEAGAPSYEAGIGAARGHRRHARCARERGIAMTGLYRPINPCLSTRAEKNANYTQTKLSAPPRSGPSDNWKITPSYYYQDRYANDCKITGAVLGSGRKQVRGCNPTQRRYRHFLYSGPERKVSGGRDADLRHVLLPSQGADATTNALQPRVLTRLFSRHLSRCSTATACTCPGATNYRSRPDRPTISKNLTQEIRLQSSDSSSRLIDHGLFSPKTGSITGTDS